MGKATTGERNPTERKVDHKLGPLIIKYFPDWNKYLIISANRELWTNSFDIIRQEYMKESEFSTYNVEKCIKVYFGGNLRRFLRKHREQYYYQLTYSRTFKKWKKDVYKNKARKEIIKLCNKLPGEVNNVTNILITLERYYDWEINKDNAIISFDIYLMLKRHIAEYNMRKSSRSNNLKRKLPHNKRQAIREQKARGFIYLSDWDDYDGDFSQAISIADRNLIYPRNILTIPIKLRLKTKAEKIESKKNIIFDTMYQGISSIGVAGYTRIRDPLNRK